MDATSFGLCARSQPRESVRRLRGWSGAVGRGVFHLRARRAVIVVVDYGVGNLASISNMLRRIGATAAVSSDPAIIVRADKVILPGVGAFDHAMRKLRERSLLAAIEKRVLRDGVPLLGLCLGAQLLTMESEEGTERGLGWVDAIT